MLEELQSSSVKQMSRFYCVVVFYLLAAANAVGAIDQGVRTPMVDGAVIDHSPGSGIGEDLNPYGLIGKFASGTQYRAVSEFDISNLPHGRVITAKLTGQVGTNNTADSGKRKHLVELYHGNGKIDIADFNSPGSEAGRFEHPSGATTDFEYDYELRSCPLWSCANWSRRIASFGS